MKLAIFTDLAAQLRSLKGRRLGREVGFLVVGNVAAVLGSLVSIRILTELLDPSAYGELALGITFAMLVSQVVMGPLASGAMRFYAPATEQKQLPAYFAAVKRLVLGVIFFVVLLFVLVSIGMFVGGQGSLVGIAASVLAFSLLTGCASILSGIQNAARHRLIVALHQGLEPWARCIAAVVFIIVLGSSASAAMSGYVIAAAFVLASQLLFFRWKYKTELSSESERSAWNGRIWTFSWPFAIWGVFTWVQQSSDRWLLGVFGDARDVGLYAALFQVGFYPISIASGIIVQLVAPILFARAGDASDSRRNAGVTRLSWQLTTVTLGFTVVAFIFTLFFHSFIFGLLVAEEYLVVSSVLPWVVLTGGIFAAGQSIALNIMSQMNSRAMMIAKVTTSVVGVLINIPLAMTFGLQGVVLGGLFFSLLYFVWMYCLQRSNEALG